MKRIFALFRGFSPAALSVAAAVLLSTLAAGCGEPAEPNSAFKTPKRVPFHGTVTVDGKPLAGAVVVFNPEDTTTGLLAQSDTDDDGKYDLQYQGFPGGTAPGVYKVTISYLVSTAGAPQKLSARSALQMPPGMIGAKELLPKKYSDMGATELTVTVPAEGATYDFKLEGPLLPAPEPPADAPAADAKPAAEGEAKPEAEAAKTEPAPPVEAPPAPKAEAVKKDG